MSTRKCRIWAKYFRLPPETVDTGGNAVHFIGHLQTNKVKQVVGKVELIHSVDSERLLRAIDSQADRLGLVQDILLEVNVAGEESKGGVVPERLPALAAAQWAGLTGGRGPKIAVPTRTRVAPSATASS